MCDNTEKKWMLRANVANWNNNDTDSLFLRKPVAQSMIKPLRIDLACVLILVL